MKLNYLLTPDRILLDIPARTREEVLVFVANRLEQAGAIRSSQDLVDLLLDRERLGATVVGDNIAIPHCKVPGLKSILAAFARTQETVPFGTEDGEAAKLFFFVLSPREQPAAHLQILATIARLLRNPLARKVFLDATTAEELVSALQGFELAP